VLCNLGALFGAGATTVCLLIFLLYDPRQFFPVLLASGLFGLGYALVPWINRQGCARWAMVQVLTTAYLQLLVITALISSSAGTHLYYLGLALVVPLLFQRIRCRLVAPLVALAAGLFVVSHFAFPPAAAWLAVPSGLLSILFAVHATGTVLLALLIAFFFRREVERAETTSNKLNEKLEELSRTDQLSGLANRRTLDEFLARQWNQLARTQEPMSIAMCDIDHFKAYNDNKGHQAGDQAIRHVADVLSRLAARPGDLVARYGGEEFVVVLSGTHSRGARVVAEKMRRAVKGARIVHGHGDAGEWLTVSLGLSTAIPNSSLTPAALLASADKALYQAKAAGRDCVVANAIGRG